MADTISNSSSGGGGGSGSGGGGSWVEDAAAAATNALVGLESQARSTATSVKQAMSDIHGTVAGTKKQVATELDDFIYLLQYKVKQGDDLAADLLDGIEKVKAGIISGQQLADAWRGITSTLTGQTRDLSTLLRDLLGNLQTTQEAMKPATTWQEILERLEKTSGTVAQGMVQLTQAFAQGKITLDFYLQRLRDLMQRFPQSGVGDLAQQLADAASEGRIGAS